MSFNTFRWVMAVVCLLVWIIFFLDVFSIGWNYDWDDPKHATMSENLLVMRVDDLRLHQSGWITHDDIRVDMDHKVWVDMDATVKTGPSGKILLVKMEGPYVELRGIHGLSSQDEEPHHKWKPRDYPWGYMITHCFKVCEMKPSP